MALDLTTASNVLKEFYLPRLREQLNDKLSPVYAQLEKSSQMVEGEQVVLSIHTSRTVATGARAEGGILPTPGNQGYQKVRTDLAYLYGRVQFTGPVIRRAKTDKGAFVNAATREMERLAIDLKHDLNRQIFNASNEALIVASGVPTGQVIPVAGATPEQYRSLIIGMVVDIGTAVDPVAGANSVTITAVDQTAETVTVTGTVTSVVNGHFFRKEDNFGNEITGLREIVSSGDTLFTVDGSAVPVWNSYVNENGGTPRVPTEILLETALDEIAIASGMAPKMAAGPHDVVRNYGAQLTSQKRFNDTTELKGGYSGVTISSGEATVGLVSDRFAPAGTIWMLNPDYLTFNEASDWEWMDEDGAVLNRRPDMDAYEATMFKYCELTTDQRNAHGRVDDLSGA